LGSHTKNEKNKKKIIYIYIYIYKIIFGRNPKIIGVKKGCWNAHKMARNWLRRFKNTRIEI
jgi:hypothetical protein